MSEGGSCLAELVSSTPDVRKTQFRVIFSTKECKGGSGQWWDGAARVCLASSSTDKDKVVVWSMLYIGGNVQGVICK